VATERRPARLSPPILASAVARPRLFERLTSRPCVAVTATAGFGKTTLLASWAELAAGPGSPVAWLSVDADDADPVRLAARTLAALRACDPQVAAALEGLVPTLDVSAAAMAEALTEALYDCDVPVTLVLDDVHHLAASPRSLEVVDQVLQWAPSGFRVVLAARTLPPLRLQRLRLQDRVELVGQADLAFTVDETLALFEDSGTPIDRAQADAVHQATEGWPAAVRLAQLAARGGGLAEVPVLGQDDSLADYLLTEVLADLEPDMRTFLLESTFSLDVCPALVSAARGTNGSEPLLERCVDDGLFLHRDHVDGQAWYRWHALFAAHMRRRLAYLHPERAAVIASRAAAWWRTSDPVRSFDLFLQADDVDAAGEVLDEAWLALALEGRTETVLALAARLPDTSRHAAAGHLARSFIEAQAGRIEAGRVSLMQARSEAKRLPDDARLRFDALASVIELSLVSDREGLDHVVASARECLEQLDSGVLDPQPAMVALVQMCVGAGESRRQVDIPAALHHLTAAQQTAEAAGLDILAMAAAAELSIPAIAINDLGPNARRARALLDEAVVRGWRELSWTAPAEGYLGWLAYWQGDAAGAREQLTSALLRVRPNDWVLRGLALQFHGLASVALDDREMARRDAQDLRSMLAAAHMPPWWQALVDGLDAEILLAGGDLEGALALLRDAAPAPAHRVTQCIKAKALLRAGEPRAALDELGQIPEGERWTNIAVYMNVLAALGRSQLGAAELAHDHLETALSLAAPERVVMPFLLVGPALQPLLAAHLRRGTAHQDVVAQISTRLSRPEQRSVAAYGEALTDRELTILRYLATNLTNSEIAAAEFISLNTAKTHIAHIYRKLDVPNRRAAVRRAAELRLL
jgi:LuxR family maltose regulon positive regulatory protein